MSHNLLSVRGCTRVCFCRAGSEGSGSGAACARREEFPGQGAGGKVLLVGAHGVRESTGELCVL